MSAPASTFDVRSVRGVMRCTEKDAIDAGIYPATAEFPDTFPVVGNRLRMRRRGEIDPVSSVALILNESGTLLWHEGAALSSAAGMRRTRRGVPEAPEGELIELYQYQPLDPNEIVGFLTRLDIRLNGYLQAVGAPEPAAAIPKLVELKWDAGTGSIMRGNELMPSGKLKRLLFVHGTFSSTDAFIGGIARAPHGAAFVKSLFHRYEQVLAYDHATLSVSPVLNAFDLARLLQKIDGPLDVIAHSRGGLVTRWALEGFGLGGKGPFGSVLVGCPINGTSLASPPRLRSSLSLLSNIGTALQIAGGVAAAFAPLLVAPLALMRIATSVVTIAARTPLVDAAVQMIPGLAGQSRIGNNSDIARIRSVELISPPTYFVVQSNYETELPGWRFWKWFKKGRIADAVADVVFPADNDLVVDTQSMADLSGKMQLPKARVLDFGTNDGVHHCNYFEQDRTLDFIGSCLRLQ